MNNSSNHNSNHHHKSVNYSNDDEFIQKPQIQHRSYPIIRPISRSPSPLPPSTLRSHSSSPSLTSIHLSHSASSSGFLSSLGNFGNSSNKGHSRANVPNSGNLRSLLTLFGVFIFLLIYFYLSLPPLECDNEYQFSIFSPPRSSEDLRLVSQCLSLYQQDHYYIILFFFSFFYIFLQSFAIPGALFLSMLAGPLFGVVRGLMLVSFVSTIGATFCYWISFYLGRRLVQRFFPQMLESFQIKLKKHSENEHNLFFYMLFLRISPLLPNWFINISSPILNIRYPIFISATFFGLIPANYIHITTGAQLAELTSGDSNGNWYDSAYRILFLFALASVALLPTLCRNRIETLDQKLETKKK